MRLQVRPRKPHRCLSIQKVAMAAMVVLSRSDSQSYGFQLFSVDHSRTRRRICATALFQATATEQESSIASAIEPESSSESVKTERTTLHLQEFYFAQSDDVSLDEIGSLEDENSVSRTRESEPTSRRIWLSEMAKSVTFLATATAAVAVVDLTYQSMYPPKPVVNTPKRIAPVNITQVAQQTNINITLQCQDRTCISLDSTTFQKKLTVDLPTWLPKQLVPPPKVIKDIPNSELWIAAVVAGSAVEMTRNALLYPLQTLENTHSNRYQHPAAPCARVALETPLQNYAIECYSTFSRRTVVCGTFTHAPRFRAGNRCILRYTGRFQTNDHSPGCTGGCFLGGRGCLCRGCCLVGLSGTSGYTGLAVAVRHGRRKCPRTVARVAPRGYYARFGKQYGCESYA